ncbi:unnamed protein product [Musa textilis]
MDRYQRVQKPREETLINENEIRITSLGRMRNYITYATSMLQENDSNEIILKAMGRAINKTIMIVELIKNKCLKLSLFYLTIMMAQRRIVDLHQNTAIGSVDITDTWEPLKEGLLLLETTRHVSVISITLSKKELDTSAVGYQPPLLKDEVKPLGGFSYGGEGSLVSRGRGHGGHGKGRARDNYDGNDMMDYGDGSRDNIGTWIW